MGHAQAEYKYRSTKCHECYCVSHLARACKSKSPRTSSTYAIKLGKNAKAKLYLKPGVVPKFHRSQPLPYAIKAKWKRSYVECQEKLDIDALEWGTPIVLVSQT